jgi:hypothetical protein
MFGIIDLIIRKIDNYFKNQKFCITVDHLFAPGLNPYYWYTWHLKCEFKYFPYISILDK